MIPTTRIYTKRVYWTHTIPRDRRVWKTSVSTTWWPTTRGKVLMITGKGSIPSSKSHVFQTTNCLILKRRINERTTSTLSYFFVPFREESSLLLENETAEEAFHRLMNDDSSAYHDKLQKILDAQSKMTEINEARKADGEEKRVNKEDDDDPQLMGEAKTAMHDMADMLVNHSTSDQLSFEDRIAMLNADQRRIFDSVDSHLQQQKQHETGECQCDFKPLRMFVSGVGGTGKSFLIEAIKLLVGKIWPSKEVTVAVAAPTGLAAFNVGGLTIHRLFQLPIEHEGKSAEYWTLSKVAESHEDQIAQCEIDSCG